MGSGFMRCKERYIFLSCRPSNTDPVTPTSHTDQSHRPVTPTCHSKRTPKNNHNLPMNLQLTDKIFIVTGGASGIGRAIVDVLIEEGAIPVLVDKNPEALVETLEAYEKSGTSLLGIEGDLVSPAFCQQAIEQTVDRYERIDGLINNAGINDKVGLEGGSPEAFIASLERNVVHVYSMAHYALPHLKERAGPIVNISSKTAITGQGGTSGYIAAKGGVLALTREWAVDLEPYQIRVNCVVPAEVWTPMYDYFVHTFDDPKAQLEKMTSKIPFGRRMTTPREIADMVVFLMSNDRAGHITGQYLHVDGGYVHLDRMMT